MRIESPRDRRAQKAQKCAVRTNSRRRMYEAWIETQLPLDAQFEAINRSSAARRKQVKLYSADENELSNTVKHDPAPAPAPEHNCGQSETDFWSGLISGLLVAIGIGIMALAAIFGLM